MSRIGTVINYLELSKPKIMIPVSLTGFTGYFIYDQHITLNILLVTAGIFFLAVSASVLNQVQEIRQDRLMERTRNRPLPSGRISKRNALVFFMISLLAGSALVYAGGNVTALLIGILTILWYNGVYTIAKKFTAFAVVPGAITGALPPLIGWVAAGGSPWDKIIVFVEFLFFIGQVPHFWLIILKYSEEYELAGFPSITGKMTKSQIGRLIFSWILVSALAAIFLFTFEIIGNPIIILALFTATITLVLLFRDLVKGGEMNSENKKYPVILNIYYLLIILLLISDRIIEVW